MNEIEPLTKMRDGLAMALDGLSEYLEMKAPVRMREYGDFDMLKWSEAKGAQGVYEQAKDDSSKEFKALQAKLDDHKGFWQSKNFKFWFHLSSRDTIDRRRKNPSNLHDRMEENLRNIKEAGRHGA